MSRLVGKRGQVTSVDTSASGGDNWVQLPNIACDWLQVTNDTGVDLEFRYLNTTEAFPIIAGSSQAVPGVNSAAQIEWRRKDMLTDQVKVKALLIVE